MNIKEFKKYKILFLIIFIILITRIYLYYNLSTFYFVDCYEYIINCLMFYKYNIFSFSRGFPVFIFIRFFYKLLDFLNILMFFKLIMIIVNILLCIILYFLTKNIFSELESFIFIFISFTDTYFIFYSLVPYLELFSYLFMFLFLLLLIRSYPTINLKYMIFAFSIFFISILIRYEILIIFIPAIIFYFITIYKISKKNIFKIVIICIFILFILYLIYPILDSYYFSTTRFSPLDRIKFGLNYELFIYVLQSIFKISTNSYINNAYILILFFGILNAFILKPLFNLYKNKNIKINEIKFNKAKILSLILIITFIMLFIIIWFYESYTYQIINQNILIKKIPINERFLLLPHLYLWWLFTYSISQIINNLQKLIKYFINYKIIYKGSNSKLFLSSISLILLLSPFIFFGWTQGIQLTNQSSETMILYKKTGDWLINNMNDNETAIVPLEKIFFINNNGLNNKILSYNYFWDKLGIQLKADTSREEILLIRQEILSYIKNNRNVKYLVVDWMDDYCQLIFKQNFSDELNAYLHEIHSESYINPNSWVVKIIVYKISSSK